jgi:hypothetical protein
MKKHIKKMLALLVTATCLQLSLFAAPKHDNRYAPPFTYWLHTTWESTYSDEYLYIEYKSFRVKYSVSLPYNVTISYNLIYQDTNGGDSNDEYITTGLQGSTETYLGYYETYYQDLNQNYQHTLDLILNAVQ